MMDIQREFENFEACMEGHETALHFFEAGWNARGQYVETAIGTAKVLSEGQAALEYARAEQEPVASRFRYLNRDGKPITAWAATADYPMYQHPALEIEPLYTHPAQPVQPAVSCPSDVCEFEIQNEALRKVNEQLLEALKEMVEMMNSGDEHGAGSDWHKKAKAAITAAEAAKGGL